MIDKVLTKIFGSKNERVLKAIQPLVVAINDLEKGIKPLDDAALAAKTVAFRERLAKGEPLDNLLPEAFAVVREAAWRSVGMRHFDVQLVGGMILHQGKIAEMKTGEGKTLVATLPLYLNALDRAGRPPGHGQRLPGQARRRVDGQGLQFPGAERRGDHPQPERSGAAGGLSQRHHLRHQQRVRFRLSARQHEVRQGGLLPARLPLRHRRRGGLDPDRRGPHPADHLRPGRESTELYQQVDRIIHSFKPEIHYTLDEKARSLSMTDDGVALGEKLLAGRQPLRPQEHRVAAPLESGPAGPLPLQSRCRLPGPRGRGADRRRVHRRAMPGRRYSDGLHQALEAKEHVKVEKENQTLASITFQNYFRMYEKLAGMTGTADTEAVEFKKIYNLDVVMIPTHNNMVRKDFADVIYKNQKAKYRAIIAEIGELHKKGQPVLVGTISIDVSEKISGDA